MSDRWDGLLGGPLPTPVVKRPEQPDRSVTWMRLLGLVLVLALVGVGVWRVVNTRDNGQTPAPVPASTSIQSHPQSTPTLTYSDSAQSVDAPRAEDKVEPPVMAQPTSTAGGLFEGAHRVVDDYAHAFYERADGEDWAQVAQKIQGLSTTAWAVELTNSPDLQNTRLSPVIQLVNVKVDAEDVDPQSPTQWMGTLALVFDDEAGNRVERNAKAGVEIVPGIGWRVNRWEGDDDE